jgi:hypothetical protein
MDPRKVHAGKTPLQKIAYVETLKAPLPANPTYKKHVEKTTDVVQEPDVISEGPTETPLKPYRREPRIGLRDAIFTILATIIGGALLYFIIEVSRQVAVLQERTEALKHRVDSVENDLKANIKNLQDMNLEIAVLKRTQKR